MNEKELIILAKNGDANAFCAVYSKYKNKLYNYAYYKLGNRDDAEDAVQNCVLTAFEEIKSLKKPDAFSAWIFRILYCSCAALIKEQIKSKATDDIDDCLNISSSDFDENALSYELREALGKLNDDERSIVLLSVIAGLQSKEISKITGFSAGNVRQKLSRSLAKMRKELAEEV